jgi:Ca2+-binding RTX toxin-like protein
LVFRLFFKLFGLLSASLVGAAISGLDDPDQDTGERTDPFPDDNEVAVLRGTDGDDTLSGTSGNDVLLGLDGDDVLYGQEGNDLLVMGDGPRSGNDFDDFETGPPATDAEFISVAEGGAGNDTLIGGSGFEKLYGGAGNDEIYAVPSYELNADLEFVSNDIEVAHGGAGEDTIYIEAASSEGPPAKIWVNLDDGDESASDTVVVRNKDADIHIAGFQIGLEDGEYPDQLDLSELRMANGGPIHVDNVNLYFDQASGTMYSTYIALPNSDQNGSLFIELGRIEFGHPDGPEGVRMTDQEFLVRIGIPTEA